MQDTLVISSGHPDILYSKESGGWLRHAGTYTKLRIAPQKLREALAREGFRIIADESGDGSILMIAIPE